MGHTMPAMMTFIWYMTFLLMKGYEIFWRVFIELGYWMPKNTCWSTNSWVIVYKECLFGRVRVEIDTLRKPMSTGGTEQALFIQYLWQVRGLISKFIINRKFIYFRWTCIRVGTERAGLVEIFDKTRIPPYFQFFFSRRHWYVSTTQCALVY